LISKKKVYGKRSSLNGQHLYLLQGQVIADGRFRDGGTAVCAVECGKCAASAGWNQCAEQ
jgi:hypothetical protein